jgi:hypothetical protein
MASANDDYVSRFDNHPLHAALRELLTQASGIQANPNITVGMRFRLERLQAGVEKTQRSLLAVDKWMAGGAALKDILRAAAQAKEAVGNFVSTGLSQESFLNSANDLLENQIFPALQRLPRLDSPVENSMLVDQIHEQIERNNELIREKQAAWELAIGAWRKDANQTVLALHQAISSADHLRQSVDAQDERLIKLVERSDAAIADINAKAADAEAQRAKTALEAEANRATRFENVASSLQDQLAEKVKNFQAEVEKERATLLSAGQSSVDRLKQLETEASELLQLIGNKGVIAPFKDSADKDRLVALVLRVLAGTCFLGLVAVVVVVAWDVHIATVKNESFDWGRVIFRLLSGLILSIPAYYFAREAAKFQNESDRNRRVQLELASIGPFIEHLDVAKRDALKEELTRRYFGTPHLAPELEKPVDLKDLLELLRIALRRGK